MGSSSQRWRPTGLTSRLRQMRVGTKVVLAVMLPVCTLLAFAVASAIFETWNTEHASSYRAKVRLSFAVSQVADALGNERLAAVLTRLKPGAASRAQFAAAERLTTSAFQQATRQAAHGAAPGGVAASLSTAWRRREALVRRLYQPSLSSEEVVNTYGALTKRLFDATAGLLVGGPSVVSSQAANAYLPLTEAIESASHDALFVASLIALHRSASPSPWYALETGQLDDFSQRAAGPLVAQLRSILASPPALAVQRLESQLVSNTGATVRGISLRRWLSTSAATAAALRALADRDRHSLSPVLAHEVDAPRVRGIRNLGLALVILMVVGALALAVRRSIVGPLSETSVAARKLSRGDLTAEVTYSSPDEIGEVVAAFRDVQATVNRLVEEIADQNRAVRENRLDHRADAAALEGAWAQLLAGMNDSMAAFAELQERQQRAEREFERIFEMSLDLVYVMDFHGYLKRVNPAFERTLGYSPEELMSRPAVDFLHPDDRNLSLDAMSVSVTGEQIGQFENRNMRADGEIRWIQWSARAVPDEGLIYGVGRDVTESRQAAEEQAALRRVATLVARAVASDEVFNAVAKEVGKLLSADIALIGRYGPGPSVTALVGWRSDGAAVPLGRDVKLGGQNVMSLVYSTRAPVRLEEYSKASGEVAKWSRDTGIGSAIGVPITVEGRVWGVMMISLEQEQSWPLGTEERLANFTELAATAIANAQAREELRQVADEQTALRRVATLVARGVAPEVVFDAVAAEVGNFLPAIDVALVGRYTSARSIEFVGGWRNVGEVDWVGTSTTIGGENVSTAVFETGQPARVDHLMDDASAATSVALRTGAHSSAGAPINVEGKLWGVVIVGSVREEALPPGIEHDLAGFTELAATAIANSQAREELAASRARIVATADEARRHIERDLHDGVQQRLIVLGLQLQAARAVASEATPLGEALGQIGKTLASALDELREIASGIHPAVLRHGGLRAAIRVLARRSPVPVEVDVPADLHLSERLKVAAYYVVSEALTNVTKHAGASGVEIRADADDEWLELVIHDDGIGGATIGAGSGLLGLTDRVEALGGRIQIVSPPSEGTTVRVNLPLAPVKTDLALNPV